MIRKILRRETLLGENAILLFFALLKLVIHLLTAEQYGYFRDELYYLAAGARLDFGYVDFPPFVAVVAALVRATLGDSLFALRLLPAVAGAATVWLAGRMARELGGGRWAQGMAALATLAAPQFLGGNSILTMDSFDALFWTLATFLLLRLLQRDEPRTWLWFGLIAGLSLTAKVTMLYFGAALVAGLLLTGQRRQLARRELWMGGAIALAFLTPYVAWNAVHGFPTLEFWANYGSKVYPASPPEFLLQQVLIMHPLSAPLWIAGLVHFLRRPELRPLAWLYLILFAVFLVQGAKNYFLAPVYPVLFAGGGVAFEALLRAPRGGWVRAAYPAVLALTAVLILPMSLPALPVEWQTQYMRVMSVFIAKSEKADVGLLPQHIADRFGWEELAQTAQRAYAMVPPEDRGRVCLVARNYGEAGALEFYRERYSLPPAISGHNSYFLWGPGDCDGEAILTVGDFSAEDLRAAYTEVTPVEYFQCGYCMPYESDRPVYFARGLRIPFEQAWRMLKVFI